MLQSTSRDSKSVIKESAGDRVWVLNQREREKERKEWKETGKKKKGGKEKRKGRKEEGRIL